MTSEKRRLAVVPLGKIPDLPLKSIAAYISDFFGAQADILPALEPPVHAFSAARMQYDAGIILRYLDSSIPGIYEKVMGVFDDDIFIPIFTHVLGEARQGGRDALISLFRLKTGEPGLSAPIPLQMERAAKVAVHEFGHLYDLKHCVDARCIMHFAGDLEQLDQTPLYFCRYCSVFLSDALSGSGPLAPALEGKG